MYNHLVKTKELKTIIYGVKKNGDFQTSLDNNFKANELVSGDMITTSEWTDVENGDLYYNIGKGMYLAYGDYIEHLYNLFKVKTNYATAYLPTTATI